MQLGYYRPVLCLIERELDISRFEVEAAYRPRNGICVAGFVATHHSVIVLRVFQRIGSNADFLQVLPVDFCRIETVVLSAPVTVRLRNSQRFHPSVALRRGVAVVFLNSPCVLFRFRSLAAEQSQPLRVLIPAEEIGNKVA